jgi:hypothetical protein
MTRGRKPIVLVNDIREQICEHWYGRDEPDIWPVWIDDIVSGVARLDWYGDKPNQIPLATTHIIKCFLFLDEISTENVMELLEFKKSQAKLYVKACTLCYRFLKRSLEDKEVLNLKYPRQSIVCEQQGIEYGYEYQNKALI